MRFSTVVLKNVIRRPLRAALTVSGVAMAVGAVVALVGIAQSFEISLRNVYESRGVDLMVVRSGSVQRMGSVLNEGLGAKIARLPGVKEVVPCLFETVSFEDAGMLGVAIQGMPIESSPLAQIKVIAGRRIEPADRRAVMLGRVLAANLDKKAGDAVEPVKGQAYRVVGICESFNVFENGSMIMTLGDLQELMDRKGEVTYFSVTADRKDRAALEELRRRIEALAPALQALPTREYADSSVEIRTARAVAWLTSTIAVLIGAVGMINTMLTAVFERTRELAVLRAIGWSKFQVMKLVMLESLLLAAVGAVAGTLLAMALTLVICRLPASGGLVSGNIAPAVMLQGLAIAIVVGVLGGAYPAYRAARLMPTVGLRHE